MRPRFFVVDEETDAPDFETDVAKWWLCEKGEKYDIWRFYRKKDEYRAYLLQRKSDGEIVAEDSTIDGVGTKHDLYERFS